MSMNNSLNDTEQNRPPRDAATDQEFAVQSAATAAVATSSDMWAAYTAAPDGLKTPQGKVWMEFEAVGLPVYLRITRSATVATTANNGALVAAGTSRRFYIDPSKDFFIDHLSTGIGAIKWRRCGSIVTRNRQ